MHTRRFVIVLFASQSTVLLRRTCFEILLSKYRDHWNAIQSTKSVDNTLHGCCRGFCVCQSLRKVLTFINETHLKFRLTFHIFRCMGGSNVSMINYFTNKIYTHSTLHKLVDINFKWHRYKQNKRTPLCEFCASVIVCCASAKWISLLLLRKR